MSGFTTNNSVYKVDTKNRTISGGIFGNNWYEYSRATILVGTEARIELLNGQIIQTSTVVAYI